MDNDRLIKVNVPSTPGIVSILEGSESGWHGVALHSSPAPPAPPQGRHGGGEGPQWYSRQNLRAFAKNTFNIEYMPYFIEFV